MYTLHVLQLIEHENCIQMSNIDILQTVGNLFSLQDECKTPRILIIVQQNKMLLTFRFVKIDGFLFVMFLRFC